jgi:hypothetical protein
MDINSGTSESKTTGAAAASTNSTLSQITGEFNDALASADTNVAQGVQVLQQVHKARLSLLTRTAATLQAQYGADDPRVKAAQAAVTATTATVGRIAAVSKQLAAVVPPVSAKGWALYGHVFDDEQPAPKPLARYTVFLVDDQKTYQEAYGFAYTDETGYFLLSYSGTAAGAGAQGKTASSAAPKLFVEIADTKAQPVYLSTTPIQLTPGIATYQNITIPSGSQPIGDPPEAIRKVAMPGQKGQSRSKRAKTS